MKRNEVKEEYKWKVEDLFPTDEDFEKAYADAEKMIDFSRFSGKLSDSGVLLEFFKADDKFGMLFDRIAVYASMKHDEDSAVSKYSAYDSKIMAMYSKYATEISFVEPELAEQDENYLKSLLTDKRFEDYEYVLRKLIRNKAHTLSEKEERLIGMSNEIFNNFYESFSMIDNLEVPLPEIDFEGKKTKLSHGVYGLIMDGGKREERKEAYEKYYSAYNSLINTITSIYSGNVKKDVFLSKAYKFGSCLEMALFSEDVDRAVYDNLLKTVDENLPKMHRYVADRKKILGYDKLYFYDMYTPLVADTEFKMNYDEAYAYVIKGLAPLGKEYQALLKKGYDERWLDVEETDGKRSGAYSNSCYDVHPYVLLNYQPNLDNVFTVAHEMGHSLHSYFSNGAQPYAKASYKIFVAEVASTVNEVLLLKYMLKDAKDEKLKKYLLNFYLDMMRGTLFRQTMFAEFEYEAHAMAERGEPLTKEGLCELYAGIGKRYYGDAIEHDYNISCEWARIPHFYRAFYVYKYATGIISAINIAHGILTEGEPAVKNYFRFLSGGCSTDPVSLLKLAGVDLSTEKPFRYAMQEFENTLKEFEQLMKV